MTASAQTLAARQLFDQMISNAWRTGDPGLVFLDRINEEYKDNPEERAKKTLEFQHDGQSQRLTVKIPPGMINGKKIRLSGIRNAGILFRKIP